MKDDGAASRATLDEPKPGDIVELLGDFTMEYGGAEGPYRVLKTYHRNRSLWVQMVFVGDDSPDFTYTPMACTVESIATINGQDSPWC